MTVSVSKKRKKMCKNKVSFYSKGKALAVAEKHNQRVYECPICFCFHCTNKENWKDEFVTAEKHENLKKELQKLKEDYKKYREYKKFYGKIHNGVIKLTADIRRIHEKRKPNQE